MSPPSRVQRRFRKPNDETSARNPAGTEAHTKPGTRDACRGEIITRRGGFPDLPGIRHKKRSRALRDLLNYSFASFR